ncbi:MAG: hypothetical protein WBV87_02590, partial [Candidatus Acidiferrales bacterium]
MSPLLYERRILFLALAAGLGGTIVAMILLWTGNFSSKLQWTLTVGMLIAWLSFAFSGAIDQAQEASTVEGKDGDVNFLHHFTKKGGGFESA